MLGIFCLRLAFGMVASLLLFSPHIVNPRFYRTHFLTALGLTAAAVVVFGQTSGMWLSVACLSMVLALIGSLVWSLEGAPGGRVLIVLTAGALAATLGLIFRLPVTQSADAPVLARVADDFSSAAVLGTATTAMLMGHSYLIAPSMSLTPLLRLLSGLFIALFVRMALAAAGVLSWTAEHAVVNLTGETLLWLPVRWLVGLAAPLVLGWMAWQAARIRSTQSATGILYVVVIFCFLGELTSQLLSRNTGYIL